MTATTFVCCNDSLRDGSPCADCVLISDASLVALARLAPQLRDLNLYHCEGTTPAG